MTYWYPKHECGLLWNDPMVNVQCPLQGLPQLAAKDAAGKFLQDAEAFA